MLQPRTTSTLSLLDTATPYEVGRRLIEATAGQTGQRFFDAAVFAMSHILGARFVFITRVADETPSRVRVLAAVRHDVSVEPWTFELEGTPCEAIYARSHRLPAERGLQIGVTVVDDAVCDRFEPARGTGHRSFIGLPLWDAVDVMIGHVALFFDEPLHDGPERSLLLEIVGMYGMRIEGELNRLLSDEAAAEALQVARAATEAQAFFCGFDQL